MVEKAGHKKFLRVKRMEWIDEGKPKAPREEDDDIFGDSNQPEERDAAKFPARIAPIFQNRASQRPKTPPTIDSLFDGDDIYDATPRAPKPTAPTTNESLSGNGGSTHPGDMPEEDDLDALMAEEEAHRTAPTTKPTSIFGNGATSRPRDQLGEDDDDLDALMAEAEAQPNPPKQGSSAAPRPDPPALTEDEDDLDALMAEAVAASEKPPKPAPAKEERAAAGSGADADEEEAMAEMDGLW